MTNRVEDVDNLARNTFQEIMDIDRELEIIRNNIEAVGGGASPSSIGVMNQRKLLVVFQIILVVYSVNHKSFLGFSVHNKEERRLGQDSCRAG